MNENKKIPVVAVVGPTASGKTKLGVMLAQKYNGEVVSADSMQIYKGMQIATAKPTKEEMQGIPHHMIDFLDIDKPFSAADYVAMAKPIVKDIHDRGKLPIIVGGTGLYVDSLLGNVRFSETPQNPEFREELYNLAKEKGAEYVHGILERLDSQAAKEIHPNNVIRVVRAIEVNKLTGKTMAETKAESRIEPSPYDVVWFGLTYSDRQMLYDRINLRVNKMIENGIVDEVKQVFDSDKLSDTAMNAIGLKEWIPYLNGNATLDETAEIIKKSTRHYAKRQLTWFRKNLQINWLFVDKYDSFVKICETCQKTIAKRNIL